MTELESAIVEVLRKHAEDEGGGAQLSSPEVRCLLPASVRPKGKNTCCIALMSLVFTKHVIRHGGGSKKFSRYSLAETQPDERCIYTLWPFVSMRNTDGRTP
jgi:hypothetical protein